MPKSKIIIDEDIDFEVQIDGCEVDSDDAFDEGTQTVEHDGPTEVDEQKSGELTDGDATSEASSIRVDNGPLETVLISDFSIDYVYNHVTDTGAFLVSNTVHSNVEVAWYGGIDVQYRHEINEPEAQDLEPTIAEFWCDATDASDDWDEVGDFYADEFVFADTDVDDLIAISDPAASGVTPEYALISNEAILNQWLFEAHSGKQSAILLEHDQGELSSFINIWSEENGGANTQEYILLDSFDFFT